MFNAFRLSLTTSILVFGLTSPDAIHASALASDIVKHCNSDSARRFELRVALSPTAYADAWINATLLPPLDRDIQAVWRAAANGNLSAFAATRGHLTRFYKDADGDTRAELSARVTGEVSRLLQVRQAIAASQFDPIDMNHPGLAAHLTRAGLRTDDLRKPMQGLRGELGPSEPEPVVIAAAMTVAGIEVDRARGVAPGALPQVGSCAFWERAFLIENTLRRDLFPTIDPEGAQLLKDVDFHNSSVQAAWNGVFGPYR